MIPLKYKRGFYSSMGLLCGTQEVTKGKHLIIQKAVLEDTKVTGTYILWDLTLQTQLPLSTTDAVCYEIHYYTSI